MTDKYKTCTLEELFAWKPTLWWRFTHFPSRLWSGFTDFIWALRHRFQPRHRYNMLRTGFPPGYYDPHMRIPAAMFELVCDFVDYTESVVNWNYDEEHRAAWKAYTAAAKSWRHGARDQLWHEGRVSQIDIDRLKAVLDNLDKLWYP